MSEDLRVAAQRRGSFAQTVKAVGWAFFGVRHSVDFDQDTARINPVHVLVAGVLAALIFIAVLLFIARWVVASGVAA